MGCTLVFWMVIVTTGAALEPAVELEFFELDSIEAEGCLDFLGRMGSGAGIPRESDSQMEWWTWSLCCGAYEIEKSEGTLLSWMTRRVIAVMALTVSLTEDAVIGGGRESRSSVGNGWNPDELRRGRSSWKRYLLATMLAELGLKKTSWEILRAQAGECEERGRKRCGLMYLRLPPEPPFWTGAMTFRVAAAKVAAQRKQFSDVLEILPQASSDQPSKWTRIEWSKERVAWIYLRAWGLYHTGNRGEAVELLRAIKVCGGPGTEIHDWSIRPFCSGLESDLERLGADKKEDRAGRQIAD
jgi:hypothetical protein